MNRYIKGVITGLFVGTAVGMYTVVRRTPLLYHRFQMRKHRIGRNVMRTLGRVSGAVSALDGVKTLRSYDLRNREEHLDRQLDHADSLA
jgi:hypothetical protein